MRTIAVALLFSCSAAIAPAQTSIWYGWFSIPANSNLHSVGNPSQARTDTVNVRFASKLPCASPVVDVHFNELDMGNPDNDLRINLAVGPATDDDVNIYVSTWYTNVVNSYNGQYTAWCPATGTGATALTEDAIKAKVNALAKETAEKKMKAQKKTKAPQ